MPYFTVRFCAPFLALPLCLLAVRASAQTLSTPIAPQISISEEREPDFLDSVTPESGRATLPTLAPRPSSLSAPPDSFYQTPGELLPWLENLRWVAPERIKIRQIGLSSEKRPLLALEITPPGVSPWKLRRLAVLCRQHGNEPEASASGARFVYETLATQNPKKRAWLDRTAILMVVICNPDGAAKYQRRTATNVDMNRDWGRKRSVEVAALERAVAAWKPHLLVDVHQWLPDERMPPPMAEASGGHLARQTAHVMAQENALRGYPLAARSRWGLDTLCHRFWGQRAGTPAILLETRHRPGVPGARDLAIQTSLTALWSALETVAAR